MNNKSTLEKRLNEKFEEYALFLYGGSLYSAIIKAGEIYNCALPLERKRKQEWIDLLRREKLPKTEIQTITIELEEDVKIIQHLLSNFDVWIVEELILILMKRIEVDLVLVVLREIWYEEINIDLTTVDEKILQRSQANESKRQFTAAVKSVKKNWGMPITNKWLDL